MVHTWRNIRPQSLYEVSEISLPAAQQFIIIFLILLSSRNFDHEIKNFSVLTVVI